VKRLWEAIT